MPQTSDKEKIDDMEDIGKEAIQNAKTKMEKCQVEERQKMSKDTLRMSTWSSKRKSQKEQGSIFQKKMSENFPELQKDTSSERKLNKSLT